MKICQIDIGYLDYLRQYDPKVSIDYTGTRKFVGVLLEINNHRYYAPMSSPKPKHLLINDNNKVDIHKINDGKLGVINLNNMIPVHDAAIIDIDISKVADVQYRNLLNNQLLHIKKDSAKIMRKAKTLHKIILKNENLNLNKRCCVFPLLEDKVAKYKIELDFER